MKKNLLSALISLSALPVLLLSPMSSALAETKTQLHIEGPTHLLKKESGKLTLRNLPTGDGQRDIVWFTNYNRFDAGYAFKPAGKEAIINNSDRYPSVHIRATAAVKIDGKYRAMHHNYCMDGIAVMCDGIVLKADGTVVKDRVWGSQHVVVDASSNVAPNRERRMNYAWTLDRNAEAYLKDVHVERGLLSFTAPKLKESKKVSVTVIIADKDSPQFNTSTLKHDICLIGDNGDNCGVIKNPAVINDDATSYDYRYGEGLGNYKRGTTVSDKARLFMCVEPEKCNSLEYRPADLLGGELISKKGAEAWITKF